MKRVFLFLVISFLLICGCTNQSISNNTNNKTPDTTDESITYIDTDTIKVNDWIYFLNPSDKYKLYKKKIDGSNVTKICDDEIIVSFSISNGWIYYAIRIDGNPTLFKIKTDGTSKQKVCDLEYLGNPSCEVTSRIEGDWIIINIVPLRQIQGPSKEEDERIKNNSHTYKVRLDGTQIIQIK